MRESFGERSIVLAREMTKKYEEFIRTTFTGAIEKYTETPPKGEFVLLIRGAEPVGTTAKESQATLYGRPPEETRPPNEMLTQLIKEGMNSKGAIAHVAKLTNTPKREIYKIYVELNQ